MCEIFAGYSRGLNRVGEDNGYGWNAMCLDSDVRVRVRT